MKPPFVFVNRRKGSDRRLDADPCKGLPLDLFHRKRRKQKDRRTGERSLTDDYYAYIQSSIDQMQSNESTRD